MARVMNERNCMRILDVLERNCAVCMTIVRAQPKFAYNFDRALHELSNATLTRIVSTAIYSLYVICLFLI